MRLLAAAVRPLAWEKHNGHPLNRQLYLPEYCLSAHDPSFGRTMDLPLVMAALMNCWGEDVLPEEVAYVMEDMAHSTTANAAFAAAAAGCCGYPCWQAWMDLADLRAQIHDDCCVAVQVERRIRGQRDPVRVWMGLRGFGHDDAVMADYVLLNDPTADSNGAVNCTMALVDFYALLYRARHRPAGKTPRCCRQPSAADALRAGARRDGRGVYYFEQRGVKPTRCRKAFPAGWPVRATTVWPTPPPPTAASAGWSARRRAASASRKQIVAAGCRCSVYAVDQTGAMRVAEVRLPKPRLHAEHTCFPGTGKAGGMTGPTQSLWAIDQDIGGTHYGKDDHHFGT